MRLFLPARPPFSLPAVVRSHGWVQLAPFVLDDGGLLSRVERLASGQVVEMVVKEAHGGVAVKVDGLLTPAESREVADKAGWMLGLDQDFSDFYAQVRHEPKLARTETEARGRILRSPTLFEDVVKTILTTNTAWTGTIRMVAALVSQFGQPLPADPARHAFPTPEQLATASDERLRAESRLGYRAPFVAELAQKVASGALDLEAFKTVDLPTPELRKKLLEIRGIGAYAAANLLMILGRYNYVPVDSWAQTMVSREWYDGERVGPPEVESAFAPWGKWQGLAFWFWNWSA